jgi:hypothetical protein
VEAVPGQTAAEIDPGEPLQEHRQFGHLRHVRKQHGDHCRSPVDELLDVRPHFLVLPRAEPAGTDTDGSRPDGFDRLLQSRLPRATRDQLVFVKPSSDLPFLERVPQLADHGLVSRVVTQEDVVVFAAVVHRTILGWGVNRPRRKQSETNLPDGLGQAPERAPGFETSLAARVARGYDGVEVQTENTEGVQP